MKYSCKIKTPMGQLTIASDGKNLIGLWLSGQKYFLGNATKPFVEKELPIFDKAKNWLEIYFSGEKPKFKLPILFEGTPFQKVVWQIISEIPYGKTITYGEIAKQIEISSRKKTSARAVGGAVGRNPISIIVPCHRVLGANQKLTGYAGGLSKKIQLLKIEKISFVK